MPLERQLGSPLLLRFALVALGEPPEDPVHPVVTADDALEHDLLSAARLRQAGPREARAAGGTRAWWT